MGTPNWSWRCPGSEATVPRAAVPTELILGDGSGSSEFTSAKAVKIQAQGLQRAQAGKRLDHT